MKRSFSTVACLGSSCDEVIEFALKNNMQGVEIRLDCDDKPFGIEDNGLKELAGKFKANGLKITDLGTNIAFDGYDSTKIEKGKLCVNRAAALNAKGIRIFLGTFSDKISEYIPCDYDGIITSLKELCAYGKTKDVEIWIETHNDFSTGEALKRVIDDVGAENLMVIWDVIHPVERGEAPEQTLKFLGDKIAHIHIKDGVKQEDESLSNFLYTRLGKGELPIREVITALNKTDYDGFLSLEWEAAWRKEIKNEYTDINSLLNDFNAYLDQLG